MNSEKVILRRNNRPFKLDPPPIVEEVEFLRCYSNYPRIPFTAGCEDTVSLGNLAPTAERPTEGPSQSQEEDEENELGHSAVDEIHSPKS